MNCRAIRLGIMIANLVIFCFNSSVAVPSSAVTYVLSGGRLGDNLIAYLHAKYIAYKYDMKLLYKPFPYSDQLEMHNKEELYTSSAVKRFSKTVELNVKNQNIIDFNQPNTLYVIPYFPESLEEHRPVEAGQNAQHAYLRKTKYPYFAVDWQDEGFLTEVRECIKSIHDLHLICPPEDCISIGVHVRKNSGGYDLPFLHELPSELYKPNALYADVIFPLKCAPDSYYIEQIKYTIDLYPNKAFYVYIFTDDPNPTTIIEKYKKEINNDAVIFDYNKGENNHHSNVLEDFFSMTNFDCFVRADSNFSIAASKVGEYQVLITPVHHHWEGRKLVIDQVSISDNRNK